MSETVRLYLSVPQEAINGTSSLNVFLRHPDGTMIHAFHYVDGSVEKGHVACYYYLERVTATIPEWVEKIGAVVTGVSIKAKVNPAQAYDMVGGRYELGGAVAKVGFTMARIGESAFVGATVLVEGPYLNGALTLLLTILEGSRTLPGTRYGKSQRELDEEKRKLLELEREVLQLRAAERDHAMRNT